MDPVYRISVRLPCGPLAASDFDEIDGEDVPFEIHAGNLVILPATSVWQSMMASSVRDYLSPRHAGVTRLHVAMGANVFTPDVIGLSVSVAELIRTEVSLVGVDRVELAVEVLQRAEEFERDEASVRRDRVVKFGEYAAAGIPAYWIVDEVPDDPLDASVEKYRLGDGVYGLVRTVRLSELLAEEAA